MKGETPLKEYKTEKAIVRIHGEPNHEVIKKACERYAQKVVIFNEPISPSERRFKSD